MAAAPPVLDELIARFDPSAFDAPAGNARLRLSVEEAGDWDFVVRRRGRGLEPADHNAHADARLRADRATWARVARDLRGGMNAFRAGRLQIRDDLHLGVGFLAATSGHGRAGPSRARPRPHRHGQHRRRAGRPSRRRAGRDAARARRHEGLLPPHRGRPGRYPPRPRDRPPGLRRLGQAAARGLRPALLRARRRRLHGCERHRPCAPDRQLDGRARGVRGRLPHARAGRPDRRALDHRWRGCATGRGRRWSRRCARSWG